MWSRQFFQGVSTKVSWQNFKKFNPFQNRTSSALTTGALLLWAA